MSDKNEGVFTDQDVIDANQKLLDAIASCDFATYRDLTASDITAIEPESRGHPVHGIHFHKYYFDLYRSPKMTGGGIITDVVTMSNPHVRWLGGGCREGTAAVITYVRLDQTSGEDGPKTKTTSETRIWENRDGKLVNVHFHKS